jgi:hypothetical protein
LNSVNNYIALFLLLCSGLISKAQEGDYYLTHHNPPAELVDNINFNMLQDQNGIIWIANRKGIVQYDGNSWTFISAPSAIFSLVIDDNNIVYGGGRNVIGKIAYNELNQLYFSSLLEDASVDDILSGISVKDHILFLSRNQLYVFNSSNNTMTVNLKDSGLSFRGIFKFNNKYLISTENKGLYKLNESFDQVSRHTEFDSLSLKTGIQWISEHKDGNDLAAIIDDEGNIHLVSDQNVRELTFEDEGYINSSIPLEAQWVTDSLLAISTLSGGVVFVNPLTEELEEIINFHTGLPDNQAYSLFIDIDDGVWVAHDYGFTRIAPLMPFTSYGNFPGLDGNILAVARLNDRIYTATNLGVYYLDEVKNFQEIEFYVRKVKSPPEQEVEQPETKKQKERSTRPKQETIIDESTDPEQSTKEKKGVFNFLKKKKKNATTKNEDTAKEEVSEDPEKTIYESKPEKPGLLNRLFNSQKESEVDQVEWQRRTKQELLSIRNVFKKIEGIPAKTNQLITAEDLLIAVGLSGLHEIRNGSAKLISDIPVRNAYYSERNKLLFASTYDNDILSFSYEEKEWQPANLLEGLEDYVFQITEQENNIWLVSADSLYRVELDENDLVDVDVFKINNPYFEDTYAVNHDGSLFFVNSSGYYYYDESTREVIEAEGLKEIWGTAERLFIGGGRNIWMFNGKEWNTLGEQTFDHDNYDFLNVFPEIRQLYYSEKEDLFWIVTAQNKIYQVTPPKNETLITEQSIYLKEIRQKNSILLPESHLNIELENSSLTFNFIQPDYSGLLGIEYQYRLIGLSNNWSEWSRNNNIVTFSFLPANEYRLEFQTRDIFGTINSINPIEFKIVDPYWRRPWFYAAEVVIFTLLLFLSIQLNRANTRYRIVSRLLAFITLILIIEFIQTVAEYKIETEGSPVIDFFIQVSIALVILPFESLLRRAIFSSKAAGASIAAAAKKKKEVKNKKTKRTNPKSK